MHETVHPHSSRVWPTILVMVLTFGCQTSNDSAAVALTPLAAGAKVYARYCVTCHQRDGSGRIGNRAMAADFTAGDGPLIKPDEILKPTILRGIKSEFGRMPAFAPVLSQADLDAVLLYIRQTFQSPH